MVVLPLQILKPGHKDRAQSAFKNASAFALGSLAGGSHCLFCPGQNDLRERAFESSAFARTVVYSDPVKMKKRSVF